MCYVLLPVVHLLVPHPFRSREASSQREASLQVADWQSNAVLLGREEMLEISMLHQSSRC